MGKHTFRRLSPLSVKRLEQGRHCDGGGLYLQVGAAGTKLWIFRFQLNHKVRDMGLGSAAIISLADARDFAGQCRTMVARGIDPLEVRAKAERGRALEAANAVTFQHCAENLIERTRPSWRSTKHAAQWTSTLEAHAYPVIGDMPVAEVDPGMVLRILEPIWNTKRSTALAACGSASKQFSTPPRRAACASAITLHN